MKIITHESNCKVSSVRGFLGYKYTLLDSLEYKQKQKELNILMKVYGLIGYPADPSHPFYTKNYGIRSKKTRKTKNML